MNKKSFLELYREKKQQKSPAQEFVSEVARITHRTETTVRMWLSGQQVPESLVCNIIAEHFSVDAESLFPINKQDHE